MGSQKTTSFLSDGLELQGNLSLEGGIRIDAKIDGNIESKSTIYVGQSALIQGNITTEHLVSAGNIQGKVVATGAVRIKTPGVLRGTVKASALVIDKEVYFDGVCQLSHPKTIVTPPPQEQKKPRKPILERE